MTTGGRRGRAEGQPGDRAVSVRPGAGDGPTGPRTGWPATVRAAAGLVTAVGLAATAFLAPDPASAQEADAVAPGAGQQTRPPDALPAPGGGDLELPDSVRGSGPSGRELDDLTARVASRLRCPVCRSQSVLESSAALSEQMQREIRRRLAAGQSPEEVEAYFVSRYGEWILLQPEPRGLNLLVYLLPAAALLAGGLLIWNRLRAWTGGADREAAAEGATGDERAGSGDATHSRETTDRDGGAADENRGPERPGPGDADEGSEPSERSERTTGTGLSPEEEERIDALIRERERGAAD